ncbi:hypothetical protein RRG08_063163, partial [Elysia crispata]
HLKPQEAGLSPMVMVSSADRRNVIDFLNPHIREEIFYIMYSLIRVCQYYNSSTSEFDKSHSGDFIADRMKTRTGVFILPHWSVYCDAGWAVGISGERYAHQ